MSKKSQNWLSWILASLGVAGVAFAVKLHRLVWTLFLVLAVTWWLVCWWAGSKSHGDTELLWLLLAVAPTLIVAIVLRIVEGIVVAIYGVLPSATDSPPVSSLHNEPGVK